VRTTRRATVVLAASLAVGAVAVPALAAAMASATTAPTSVSVLSYGAAAGAEGSPPVKGPYTFAVPQGNSVHLFRVHNTGTVPLTAQTYQVTGNLLNLLQPVQIIACINGTWSGGVNNGVCSSGQSRVLATTSQGAVSAPLDIPVGGSVQLRGSYASVVNISNDSVTVNITVSRSQARAATTTSS